MRMASKSLNKSATAIKLGFEVVIGGVIGICRHLPALTTCTFQFNPDDTALSRGLARRDSAAPIALTMNSTATGRVNVMEVVCADDRFACICCNG